MVRARAWIVMATYVWDWFLYLESSPVTPPWRNAAEPIGQSITKRSSLFSPQYSALMMAFNRHRFSFFQSSTPIETSSIIIQKKKTSSRQRKVEKVDRPRLSASLIQSVSNLSPSLSSTWKLLLLSGVLWRARMLCGVGRLLVPSEYTRSSWKKRRAWRQKKIKIKIKLIEGGRRKKYW